MTEQREVYEPPALVARLVTGTRVAVHISPEAVMACCGTFLVDIECVQESLKEGVIIDVFDSPSLAECGRCGDVSATPGYRFRVTAPGWDPGIYPAIALTPIEEAAGD